MCRMFSCVEFVTHYVYVEFVTHSHLEVCENAAYPACFHIEFVTHRAYVEFVTHYSCVAFMTHSYFEECVSAPCFRL